MRKVVLIGVAIVLYLGAYGLAHWRQLVMREADLKKEHDVDPPTQRAWDSGDASQDAVKVDSLPALDAQGFNGIHEINRPELVKLMTKFRPLSQDENANLNRGCPGFACLYQGLGLTRWPELARGTVAYLTLVDALNRICPNGQKNFVFLKQGWWLAGSPPTPNPTTGQVPVNSVTRIKPGLYTFNYAVYFPSTATYAWINHRDYGFPINLIKPQKASLSLFPPPLNDARPAQIYCSTCR
jgi:hypothetical protein